MNNDLNFKIPIAIINDKKLSSIDFVLLCNLIQNTSEEKDGLCVRDMHHSIMYTSNIRDIRSLKKSINNLYNNGLLNEDILNLPRSKAICVRLIPQIKEYHAVNINARLFDYSVLREIEHTGVRLLCYYISHQENCKLPLSRITEDLGLTKSTILKYNSLMEKLGFLEINKQRKHFNEYIVSSENITRFANENLTEF